jgi:hypothetical protein
MAHTAIPADLGSGGKGLGRAGSEAHGTVTFAGLLSEIQGTTIRVATKQVTVADLTLGALSQLVDFDAALPAGAWVVGREITITTPFSGGGATAATVDLGGKAVDEDAVVDGADVFTGAATPKAGTSGINPTGMLGGQTPTITVTSDVNVDTLLAGDVTVKLLYFVPA